MVETVSGTFNKFCQTCPAAVFMRYFVKYTDHSAVGYRQHTELSDSCRWNAADEFSRFMGLPESRDAAGSRLCNCNSDIIVVFGFKASVS